MTDYSWLEPMERRTKEIREETQRIKDETEKMRQETHNLPVPDDAPWLNLSKEEVEELRNKKHELTEYGKQRLRELIYKQDMKKMEDAAKDIVLENLTHEEMLEIAEKREAENKALAALDELYEKHGDAMLKLAEIEKDEWERRERADTVLARYNAFYNEEVSGMPHGMVLSMEHLQCITLECMVDALICENMNVEYNVIAIDDIKDLIEGLYRQSNEFLERVRTLQQPSQGHSKTDLDTL
jgi:type I site-specific restriction endonuclease